MLLSKLIETSKNNIEITNFKDIIINGIEKDSRLVKKDYIFFAIDGIKNKGLDFVDSAINNGASVIITDKDYKNNNLIVIKTKNIVEVFGKMLKIFYNDLPEHIIGITGTSGKTSVAEFTRQVIQKLGLNSASIGTLGVNFENSHLKEDTLTMRETVDLYQKLNYLKKEKKINYVTMEYTSQGMHQKRAIGIIPEIAVFTNITPEHLDYHKDMEDYFNKKMILFKDILKNGSIAIFNADIPEANKVEEICKKCNHKILTFGFNGDIKILNIENKFDGQKAIFEYLGKKYVLNTPFIGQFQIMNLLATFAVIVSMNIEKDIDKIIKCLENVKSAEGRMELAGIKKNGASIYVDFAHKPDALEKVLKAMREHIKDISNSRLCVLFGCGGDRDKTKRPIMGKIANDLADLVFITDDNPRTENAETIRNEINATCPKAYNIEGRENALKKAISMLKSNDILICAGKGHEKYVIIGKTQYPFDEFGVIKNCINNKN